MIFPDALSRFNGAKTYDRSCSEDAKVIFIDKDCGYFLKFAAPEDIAAECEMTRYFHAKGLAPDVADSGEGWMLTERVRGEDCTSAKYLEQPERLCDKVAELLLRLHSEDFSDCPANHRYSETRGALIHGDFCLPNIILDGWDFTGFVDLDCAGVGDRHVDLFWAIWSLNYNLKTDCKTRLIDAYGRDRVVEERLRFVAEIEKNYSKGLII